MAFTKWWKRWNVLAQSLRSASRPRSLRDRARVGVEQLEDRTVPTVAFDPAFGTESVVYAQGNTLGGTDGAPVPALVAATNPTALKSPHIYLIFSGTNWVDGSGNSL